MSRSSLDRYELDMIARRNQGPWFSPADPEAERRAQDTGEETECCNCWHGFSHHSNGKCPT